MNLQKTLLRLQHEAKAKPKQAIVLGLVSVVGLYFWLPLAAPWFGHDNSSATVKPPDSNADVVAGFTAMLNAQTPAKSTSGDAPQFPWATVADWLDRDPQTTPPEPGGLQRDPFFAVLEKPTPVVRPKVIQAHVAPSVSSLVLQGTMIGSRRRMAIIDGKAYEEGAPVKVNNKSGRATFVLREVQSHRAILVLDGQRYELKIPGTED